MVRKCAIKSLQRGTPQVAPNVNLDKQRNVSHFRSVIILHRVYFCHRKGKTMDSNLERLEKSFDCVIRMLDVLIVMFKRIVEENSDHEARIRRLESMIK